MYFNNLVASIITFAYVCFSNKIVMLHIRKSLINIDNNNKEKDHSVVFSV